MNEAGATKWYTEVSWTHKEGGGSREYICKLPVAIKESVVDQQNAPVAWVNDVCGMRCSRAWGGTRLLP